MPKWRRSCAVALRSVSNLLDRYDELRALAAVDRERLNALLRKQRRVVLAIDGLQPDVGHEVLWVLRDCLSGEILLARSLLSATIKDLRDRPGITSRSCFGYDAGLLPERASWSATLRTSSGDDVPNSVESGLGDPG